MAKFSVLRARIIHMQVLLWVSSRRDVGDHVMSASLQLADQCRGRVSTSALGPYRTSNSAGFLEFDRAATASPSSLSAVRMNSIDPEAHCTRQRSVDPQSQYPLSDPADTT